MEVKKWLLAGMIVGLLGAGTAYAGPGFDVSAGTTWIQNVSDEEEGEGEAQEGNQGEEEGQGETPEEGAPSSEGEEDSST